MSRATVGALVGLLLGATAAPALVWLATLWLNAQPNKPTFLVDHWVIYLTLVLGAGFGALSGAVIGLAGAITVALRRRDSVSGAPSSPEPPRKA
jgi:hypothetical protein